MRGTGAGTGKFFRLASSPPPTRILCPLSLPVDLQELQIDRSSARPAARRSRSRWFGRVVFLGLVLGLGFLFRRPLLGLVDRLRLPEVRVLEVSVSRPSAAGALEGTAANGYIVARTRAALSADTPGRIVEMNVSEGQAVPKGFVVARLYSDEVQALFARAEADLALAQRAVESARANRAAAAGAVEEAKTHVRAAGADLEDLDAGLRLAGIEYERDGDRRIAFRSGRQDGARVRGGRRVSHPAGTAGAGDDHEQQGGRAHSPS